MAGGRFSVEAIFKAVDRMSAPIAKMSSRIDRMTRGASSSLVRVDRAFSKVHGGIMRTGAVLAGAGVAAGFVAGNILQSGADFEEAITAVGAVGLKTRAEIASLEKKALELGATTKFTATEAANAMEVLSRAGFSSQETLGAVGGVLSAAAASGLEIAEVANHVSNALKGMGLDVVDATTGMNNAARVADVLALASARTNSTIGSLGESLKSLAPVARQLKIPFEDTIAAVALLQDVGLDASEAGTATATMLTRLATPTDAMRAKMRGLGIAFQDAKGNALPLAGILANFDKAAKKSGGDMKVLAFFSELVGLRGQKAALNLKELFKSGKLTSLIDELGEATGKAEAMARLRMDNLKGDWTLFESAVDGVKVALFGLESGPLRNMVQGWTAWVTANQDLIVSGVQGFLADLRKELPNVARNVKDVASKAFEFFGTVRDNLPMIITWTERIGKATVAFYALWAAVKVGQLVMATSRGVVIAWQGAVIGAKAAAWLYTNSLAAMRIASITAGHALGGMQTAMNASALGASINGVTSSLGKAGLLGAALSVGYAFGTWLDKTFNLSDKLADFMADLTGVNDGLKAGGGRRTERGFRPAYAGVSPAVAPSPGFNFEEDSAQPGASPLLVSPARALASEIAVQMESRQTVDVNVSAAQGTKAEVTQTANGPKRSRVTLPASGRKR